MEAIEEHASIEEEETSPKAAAVMEDTDEDSSSRGEEANEVGFLTTVQEEEGDDDEDGEEDEDEEVDSLAEEPSIPLFQYSRIHGSLPRAQTGPSPPLTAQRTCSVLGHVILSAESTTTSTEQVEQDTPDDTELWQDEAIAIAAYGFANGQVWLVDALTGVAVAGPDKLSVRSGNRSQPIVGLSMDVTGTLLAALDAGGMCTVFELRYAIRSSASANRSSSRHQQQQGQQGHEQAHHNVFGFLSAFTGGNSSPRQVRQAAGGDDTATPQIPTLTLASIQISRISYPNSFGRPTCLAIDPAYRRKREKALFVGFADGRLVMTKRGFLVRRSDSVLYQGTDAIQALVWRQSMVAWADSSGVRLLDTDTLQRIAHVDRPSGARPSLYPVAAHPTLVFETNEQLLVAWGDCLLTLHVGPPTVERRSVDCTMAWGMDCITCGVAPLDAHHVVVLGLVLEDYEDGEDGDQVADQEPSVELQVVSRATGQAIFADRLPLLRVPAGAADWTDSTADYQLLSSFSLPPPEEAVDPNNMFAGPMVAKPDAHLEWSLDDVVVKDEHWTGKEAPVAGDDDSVDSDDYGFVLRPLEDHTPSAKLLAAPPVMVLACGGDAVLARTRDADDAVSYALEQQKYALALHRALQHRQRLRRYKIPELVNEYLRALLRLDNSEKTLSMRRMKLAAKAMPKLLGGSSDAWEQWIGELEKLPGALFVVRDCLPVRDPKLGKSVYARILTKMLEQVEEMANSTTAGTRGATNTRITEEAEEQFLRTFLSWGTTRVLSDFVKICEFQYEIDPSYQKDLDEILASLARREEQTAAVYLNFGQDDTADVSTSDHLRAIPNVDDTRDALFRLDDIEETLRTRLSLGQSVSPPIESQIGKQVNRRVTLDAMAKLCMMKGSVDEALKHYLAIGALHSVISIQEVEVQALSRVTSSTGDSLQPQFQGNPTQYAFVIYLIEKFHLHQYVLDTTFLPEGLNTSPLFALAQLVGLDSVGRFLVSNCVAPQRKAKLTTNQPRTDIKEKERIGTLPLDLVAAQLEASPKLLHWYLHLVFVEKPELYVIFPNTAIPPPIVTSLHRKHLGLHIKYAGVNKDSAKVLEGVENYRVASTSTPLLSFLKGVLPLGGIGPIEVGKMLEVERRGGAGVSRTFALELAYIMENYGNDTPVDAALVLELYLKGAQSLMLAVSYAQRATKHSPALWQSLIDHCLAATTGAVGSKKKTKGGALFGSLLEAAALSGADLAHLVKQIPHGMAVEGLRPRLVAAVADYRLKLQMHESASAIALNEKKDLLRECGHRARRGTRFETPEKSGFPALDDPSQTTPSDDENAESSSQRVLPASLRPRQRCDRHSSALSLTIR